MEKLESLRAAGLAEDGPVEPHENLNPDPPHGAGEAGPPTDTRRDERQHVHSRGVAGR